MTDLDLDEIFIDSHNLPNFNTQQFEGRLEKPLPRIAFFAIGAVFFIVAMSLFYQLWQLQVRNGTVYAARGEANRLDHTTLFADRGVIYDRNGVPLAWNEVHPSETDFSKRTYASSTGLSSVLGFVKYPSKDSSGFYYQEDFTPKDGIEKAYDNLLKGMAGTKLVEVSAGNAILSESTLEPPKAGQSLTLSIDSRVQHALYGFIQDLSQRAGFTGGAAVIMNSRTGEVIAKVSYPEYSSDVLTQGDDSATINSYLKNPSNPFLNRAVDGLYTPGSIVKPFMALGALTEGVIDPNKQILSTGSISLPNPYQPGQFTVFKDWRAQGWVDMRHAIAVSSDVYFYEVGGGFQGQKGMGISNIDKYMQMFKFGQPAQGALFAGVAGTIPTPDWKRQKFNGEDWTLGDTYHTAIGQYGFQVSPIQIARAYSSIANDGIMVEPTIIKGEQGPTTVIPISKQNFEVVKEGMRLGVTEGIAGAVKVPFVSVAAKTGTAELGMAKKQVNSWITGFFPYENPEYVFAVLMERGPVTNLVGSPYLMGEMLNWMHSNTPEYFATNTSN